MNNRPRTLLLTTSNLRSSLLVLGLWVLFAAGLTGCAFQPATADQTPAHTPETAPILPAFSETPASPAQTPTSDALPALETPATPGPCTPCPPGSDETCAACPEPEAPSLPPGMILARPIATPGRIAIDTSYRFGTTNSGARDPHHGVEFLNSFGTPVLAAADGVVLYAGDDARGGWGPRAYIYFYGNFVVLEHPPITGMASFYTVYAHLSEILVQSGDTVRAGDFLGEVGFTGAAIGSHLHFEVRSDPQDYFTARNPELWLGPLEIAPGVQTGALAGRIVSSATGSLIPVEIIVIKNEITDLAYYLNTYEEPRLWNLPPYFEHFAIGDLPPGWYEISFITFGFHKIRAEILPGQVTEVTIEINPNP